MLQALDAVDQRRELIRLCAGFLRLGVDVHLNANIQRMNCRVVQALCHSQSVDGVYPMEVACDGTGFVGLNGTDEMPVGGHLRLLDLRHRLL